LGILSNGESCFFLERFHVESRSFGVLLLLAIIVVRNVLILVQGVSFAVKFTGGRRGHAADDSEVSRTAGAIEAEGGGGEREAEVAGGEARSPGGGGDER